MHRQAYLLLVLTTLFWGGNAIAGKLAVGHISPMLLTAARWGIAAAILAYLGRQRIAADWPAIRARLPFLMSLGFFGFTIFNVALYSALKYTSAINASIEQAGMPMLIFIVNFLLFGLRASAGQIIGFLLSIVGVALTASHGDAAAPAAARDQFRRRADAARRHRLQRLHGGAAQQARCPLAKPDDRAHRERLRHHATLRCCRVRLWRRYPARRQGWAIIAYTAIFPSSCRRSSTYAASS